MNLLFSVLWFLAISGFLFGVSRACFIGLRDIDSRWTRSWFARNFEMVLYGVALFCGIGVLHSASQFVNRVYALPSPSGNVLVLKHKDGTVDVRTAPSYGVLRVLYPKEEVKENPTGDRRCSKDLGTVIRIEGTPMAVTARACAQVTDAEAFFRSNPEANLDMVQRLIDIAALDALSDPSWPDIVKHYTMSPDSLKSEGAKLLEKHLLALGGLSAEFTHLQVPNVH